MKSRQATTVLCIFATVFAIRVSTTNADETVTRLVEIFRDDFNTDDYLNDSKWTVADRHTASQAEVSYYMEENVGVKNEYLILHCEQEYHQGCNYTSSRVDSNGKFEFLYGEVEWRAKLPGGPDFYTGLWLNRPSTVELPLEFAPPSAAFIDNGGINSQRLFHSLNDDQQVEFDVGIYSNIYLSKKPLAFHKFKMVWTNTSMEWYIDEHKVYWITDPVKIPHIPLQIVMNIVVGGAFCETQADGTRDFQVRQVLVDYVVVRQNRTFEEEDSAEEMYTVSNIPHREDMPWYFIPVIGTLGSLLLAFGALLAVLVVLTVRRRRRRMLNGGPHRF
ncbi:hypothetical protein BV898_16719 [Hypsibius exemplaris]|uniref:GH16 domain-containing protein n=1 Tax=Hypsibius exemplaris TaxID=2072580 RepID=A0A9X6NGE4_HYPEX|nr:hypothetical protein BV898_16719 [Hypsibius exemplaris]